MISALAAADKNIKIAAVNKSTPKANFMFYMHCINPNMQWS